MAESFTDILFSWSLDNILNEHLYQDKVEEIPESFESVSHYLGSYLYPLLEETRAQLCSGMEKISSAPFAEVISFEDAKPYDQELYNCQVDGWKNRFTRTGEPPYKTLPGDIFILADFKPEFISDLERIGKTWTFASVQRISEDEEEEGGSSTSFKVKAAVKNLDMIQKSMFVVFLFNMVTHKRIWSALHFGGKSKIVKEVLCPDSMVGGDCSICRPENLNTSFLSSLNDSQMEAVLSCLHKTCCEHKSSVELIWGPPGTGKTKTVSFLLYNLMKNKCRTITVAPTNVAIVEVAKRVLKLVKDGRSSIFHSLGDVLLFGNKERLKVVSEVEEIYLDYRVLRLIECLVPLTGWRHCFASMIDFLEDCVSQYKIFLENELMISRDQTSDNEVDEQYCERNTNDDKVVCKSFLEFSRVRFNSVASSLRRCISIFCTHLPTSCILEHSFQNMATLISSLDSFECLLFQQSLVSGVLEELFTHPVIGENLHTSSTSFCHQFSMRRSDCLSILKALQCSLNGLELPSATNIEAIKEFCCQNASLIFCTASSSYKLYSMEVDPFKVVVIDEAAQLKECESLIPLQLPDIKHAILIGDERQLPAFVASELANEAGFGRSLFERLSSMGQPKHLLNIQYRMHPSISLFPNSKFYSGLILNGPNVKSLDYQKNFLSGAMFGSYSFININDGREEKDDVGHSRKNMVEVAVVWKIVQSLYRAWASSKEKLSIGVISPYSAQVAAIQEKLGRQYDKLEGFTVKVKSVDGFQGGEEDIILISTVRSNRGSSVGFLSNDQRTNVALTRARYCLWILGNDKTLSNSDSIWADLVFDAKKRDCFFDADKDVSLSKAMLEMKKEFDQLEDLLKGDSVLFSSARWKILFSDRFLKSFKKLPTLNIKKKVLNLLLKLASGWRPSKRDVNLVCGNSTQILKQFKMEHFYVVCAIDVAKQSTYMQVLRVWDILPLEDISKLIKHLDGIFCTYTDEYNNLCQEICYEGKLEIPKNWELSSELVRFKSQINDSNEDTSDGYDGRNYVENSKVKDSLLLMKFYSLSFGVVSHLLSGRDGIELDLPFEVTDEELEIILYQRSTFILGRSGTGKTTVLTMKLFQKEKLYHLAVGSYGVKDGSSLEVSHKSEILENPAEKNGTVLRQLFLTVSPKLCYAVRQQVSHLKSHACGGNITTAAFDMENMDDLEAQFMDVPDSLANLPPKSYPLVITFHKFLMMLDGTLSNSYFERFCDVQLLHGQIASARSVSLQTFLRKKEVNYDRFNSSYWPHFNTQLTKKLDCSRVFTEIISHIKGDLQAIEKGDGKLSRENYVILSDGRTSSLTKQEREMIYDIFQSYEKLKIESREFDLEDFVIDLHHRLRDQGYEGEKMDFVYIDEVQDLTMSQLALFSYICNNVEEGFVFSGDTAQTIARGIDFRFQDIKSLFYKKFVLPKRSNRGFEREDKGQISEIFHLSQNFRTHAGVLHLSQSVIDLLYHFFPQSIDILKPETSRTSGETPVLLECGNNENAIKMIFGNRSDGGISMEGFGAEQVILVRDDSTQKEIINYVGKKALVLTILECKGLEFQDVLLYNFFGSSPLKNKWRVIYKYMEEQEMLDSSLSQSIPQFSKSKHGILCSELKQLYVAVTRTKQRLWFCEDKKEHSGPIFDYWKKKCAVQVQQLDDSLAQSMLGSSSKEDWRSQGIKLYHEHNYKMATLCFERAGDAYWERRSKAAGLKAYAESIRSENPTGSNTILREAAEIFEDIGKADSAAQCFFDIGEFERAGLVFLEKCGESELDRAGECFLLAKCYDRAADAYARGNFFAECLSACTKGQLFEMGSQYILSWKHDSRHDRCGARNKDIEKLEQEFLKNCAIHYHSCGDKRSMMKSVKAFSSADLMRKFLKSLNCVDELILLEEELGNFLEASEMAKTKGDLLHVADLLGKAGNFYEALMLLVPYVLAHSLWSPGSKGWPLKPFEQKQELLRKAKSFAENDSRDLYELICTEADILSVEHGNLETLRGFLAASYQSSLTGEMLTVRMILDIHLHIHLSKFSWEEKLVSDLTKHSEEMFSKNQVSGETMVYFWSCWKDGILNIFKSLQTLTERDSDPYNEFCLNFFGVWRTNSSYILLNSEADWARKVDERFLHRNGKLISIDAGQFISSARGYWCSELLSSGFKVLKGLESLYKFSNKQSTFSQCRLLTLIFEVAKFLLDSKYLNHTYHDKKALDGFCKLATGRIQSYLLASNAKVSLEENVISLRITSAFQNLLNEVIAESVSLRSQPTYGQLGRIAVLILGMGKLDKKLSEEIVKWSVENPPWSAFIQELHYNISAENQQGHNGNYAREVALVWRFHEALRDTYNANWIRERDYISPFCFLHLVERLVITMSLFQGHFVTTKSSFVEWLIFHQGNSRAPSILGAQTQQSFQATLSFLSEILRQFLFDMKATQNWVKNSHNNVKDFYPVLIRRLVVIVCLLLVNFQACYDILFGLLGCNFIAEHLPMEFCNALKVKRKSYFPIDKVAEFFKGIENPMVVVSLAGNRREFICKDAIFIDMKNCQGTNDILSVLFPKEAQSSRSQTAVITAEEGNKIISKMTSSNSCKPEEVAEPPSSSSISAIEVSKEMESGCENGKNLSMSVRSREIFEALNLVENELNQVNVMLTDVPQMKIDVKNWIRLLTDARSKGEKEIPLEDGERLLLSRVDRMLHKLNSVSAEFSMSEHESKISELGSNSKMELKLVLSKLLNEDSKTEAAGDEKFDAEDVVADEEACNGSSNGETAEAEPEEAGNFDSKREGKHEGGAENKGKGKPKSKPKKKKKGKGHKK